MPEYSGRKGKAEKKQGSRKIRAMHGFFGSLTAGGNRSALTAGGNRSALTEAGAETLSAQPTDEVQRRQPRYSLK